MSRHGHAGDRAAAAHLEALFPGKYLSVTSFVRDGTGVHG
jgi:hypothetical protein